MWFKISLISSPPANGAFGISPRIARWKRAELGANHLVNRETADKRNSCNF